MPKKDGSPTVAEKRAAGTNNRSVNQAKKAAAAASNSGGGGNRNSGGGNSNSGGGNRNSGSSHSSGGGGGGSSSSRPTVNRQKAKAAAAMSVQERRSAAKQAGVKLKDYKAGDTSQAAVDRKNAAIKRNNAKAQQIPGIQVNGFNGGPNNFGAGANNNEQTSDTVGGGENKWDGSLSNWGANTPGNRTGYYDMSSLEDAPEGLKPGDMYFNPDNFPTNGPGGDTFSGITGRVAWITPGGKPYPEFNNSSQNLNWDSYAPAGAERMSSEGLYQDKYSVGEWEGFEGYDYAGGEQHSDARNAPDIVNDYFKHYQEGTQSFDRAYRQFVGDGQNAGYAGDVLKMIDKGIFPGVSDDAYNRAVVDAKAYNWDARGKREGYMSDASRDFEGYDDNYSYDIRSGGLNTQQANYRNFSNEQTALARQSQANNAYQEELDTQFEEKDEPSVDYNSSFSSWHFDPAKAQQGQ